MARGRGTLSGSRRGGDVLGGHDLAVEIVGFNKQIGPFLDHEHRSVGRGRRFVLVSEAQECLSVKAEGYGPAGRGRSNYTRALPGEGINREPNQPHQIVGVAERDEMGLGQTFRVNTPSSRARVAPIDSEVKAVTPGAQTLANQRRDVGDASSDPWVLWV